MNTPDLFSWTPPIILGDRDGQTYDAKRDRVRLNAQAQRVYNAMSDGEWKTLRGIAAVTGDPEASISARIRDLRKPKFGGYDIPRRCQMRGLWEYRMVP